jgi:hypothetical protein
MQNHQNFERGSHALWVWYCQSCHAFHVRANQVILTFSHEEYAAFTRAVVACYCQNAASFDEEEEPLVSLTTN